MGSGGANVAAWGSGEEWEYGCGLECGGVLALARVFALGSVE